MEFFKKFWIMIINVFPKSVPRVKIDEKLFLEEKIISLTNENEKLEENLERLFVIYKESLDCRGRLLEICQRESVFVPDELKIINNFKMEGTV